MVAVGGGKRCGDGVGGCEVKVVVVKALVVAVLRW